MRYHVKGGIWKNTEDEILKAAVMKYGLNQWSRISSLLVRKSAKQCKERWYEWLDPSIKKTEWTKDEEEKLLQFAKAFPCQWRTIAPMIGRTAYQCMEQYEKLLDRAQGRQPDENDPRKLRPGEIDPNPETKPARPDPIDMDEDEKEMLNECRARLANTRGKKAKRKAREKQLEEARRLAALQKKRELKSAGIDVVLRLPRKKKKEMNFNIDVPFMRKVKEGSWKFTPEETPEVNEVRGAINLQYLENRKRDDDEEKYRKIDERRMKNLKQKDLPQAIEMINKMNDPTNILQRNKLILPEPQITDRDLEGISKLSENNINLSEINESNATKVLLGEYSQRVIPLSMMRTPILEDSIMKEAKMAASLRETSTPLKGGEDASLDLQNYINYKKTEKVSNQFKNPVAITPNLFSQAANNISIKSANTNLTDLHNKSVNSNISQTPLRDEMKINISDVNNVWETSANISKTESFAKPLNVKELLNNLPKPMNNYEIDLLDNFETLNKQTQISDKNNIIIEDSEERDKRMFQEKLDLFNKEQSQNSKVIQRKLPRPIEINKNYNSYLYERVLDLNPDPLRIEAENLIHTEMMKIIEADSINFPIKGSKVTINEDVEMEEYTLEELQTADSMIKSECNNFKLCQNYNTLREQIINEIYYIPDVQKYCFIEEIELSQRFDSMNETFEIKRELLTKEQIISQKYTEKAGLLTNGYLKRLNVLQNEYEELVREIKESENKHKMYLMLKEQEDKAIIKREKDYEKLINLLKEKEKKLQIKYKKFSDKIKELELV